MPAIPPIFAPQEQRHTDCEQCHRSQPVPPRRTQEVAARDQRPGQEWQRLPALLIHGDDLRHDIEQERGDDAQRDNGDQRRIDERERKLLSQHLSGFEIVREPGQDPAELPRLGADRNETPIKIREGSRKPRHRGRERLASRDLVADRFQEPRRAGMIGLLGQRGQRLVERHSRCDQCRHLPRRKRQQHRRQPRRFGERRDGAGGGLDRRRKQAVGAQQIARRARGRRIDDPASWPTGGVDGLVTK